MGKASKKETENNPSLNDEILGFKENGKNRFRCIGCNNI